MARMKRWLKSIGQERSTLSSIAIFWTIFGRRLDGWTNADHPTEFTPGNPSGLPSGVDINATDLDYTGMIMPPPGSNAPSLPEDEKIRRLNVALPTPDSDQIFLKVRRR